MGGNVNFVYDLGDAKNPDELKHFLFLESVRISQEKQELIEEKRKIEFQRKQLVKEKEMFEKQWKVLEKELRRIGNDKDSIARDKAYIEREKAFIKRFQQQQKMQYSNGDANSSSVSFFAGVSGTVTLRKRYRELLKIYHPDNGSGDADTLLAINKEYERLKKQYGID